MEARVSAPLQGLRMEAGGASLTQAAGLGCERSPLWGWEVRTSISKSLRQIRTVPKQPNKITGVQGWRCQPAIPGFVGKGFSGWIASLVPSPNLRSARGSSQPRTLSLLMAGSASEHASFAFLCASSCSRGIPYLGANIMVDVAMLRTAEEARLRLPLRCPAQDRLRLLGMTVLASW